MATRDGFRSRFGPWAVVAGGSEGLGESFARALAARGLSLVLAARRPGPLEESADSLRRRFPIEVRTAAIDLGVPGGAEALERSAAGLDVGLLVCNAASSPIGPFLEVSSDVHRQLIELNCRSAAVLAHAFGRRMTERGSGGIVIVTSLAGMQGTAQVAHYAASKAYLRVLAEGLWQEMRPRGVDVLACCAGQVRTPAFERSAPRKPFWLGLAPPMEPDDVAEGALQALGRTPVFIPGWRNRAAAFFSQRLLPRRLAVAMFSSTTTAMYPPRSR